MEDTPTGAAVELGRHIDGRIVAYDETLGLFAVGDQTTTAEAIRGFWLDGDLVWGSAEIEEWFLASFPSAAPSATDDPRGKLVALTVAVTTAVFVCGPIAVLAGINRADSWWIFLLFPIALITAAVLLVAAAPSRTWVRFLSAVAFWFSWMVFAGALAIPLFVLFVMMLAGMQVPYSSSPKSSVAVVCLVALLSFDILFALFGWFGGRLQTKWHIPPIGMWTANLVMILAVWAPSVLSVVRVSGGSNNDPSVLYLLDALASPVGPFVALLLGSWLGLRRGPFEQV